VESGSDKVLKILKKGETRKQLESAISTATELGFHVRLFFLIGCPGEGKEDIKQSFQLARKYEVDQVLFFNLTPIPGTEFYEWAVGCGYLDDSKDRYPEDNFGFSGKASFRTDTMTVEQLTKWVKQARHVERQILWRSYLRSYLHRITGNRVNTSNAFHNALSWIVSYSVLIPLLSPLLTVLTKLLAGTVRLIYRRDGGIT